MRGSLCLLSLSSLFALAVLGGCSSDTAPMPVACISDTDCDEGWICANGACHERCDGPEDCPDGQICVEGACLTGCADDDDCPEGETCRDGTCHLLKTEDGGVEDGGETDGGGQDGDAGPEPCQPVGAEEPCGTNEGTCRSGTRSCLPDGSWSTCEGNIGPETEDCDGLDNDCDGLTDEEAQPTADQCLSEGVCGAVEIRCQLGAWLCIYPVGYQKDGETICDGLDNDCDGLTDELLAPPANYCPDTGICVGGLEASCLNGQWACDHPEGYETEEQTCDGLDNDCDGATDEGLFNAPPGTCLEQGVCAATQTECVDAQWVCRYPGNHEPNIETRCDGLDNDCDGATDEDLQANICSQSGVCAGTRAACENGTWACHYPPEYEVPDTSCDGIDNDCDGLADSGIDCAGACCAIGQICRYDICIQNLGGCGDDGDCQEDTYCDDGACIPYGLGPRGETNPDCTRLVVAGLFQPALQCEWTGPPAGDPYPIHVQVLGTPCVADFNFDNDPNTRRPSIVFASYDGTDGGSGASTSTDGLLRIIDGATCQTLFSLGPYLNGCNSVAIGDLDGDPDGRPEIVAHRNNGGVIAYKYNDGMGNFDVLWVGHDGASNPVTFSEGSTGWGGPSLADLDDDGSPEILSGGLVYDASGLLLDSSLGLSALFRIGWPVVADLDGDGLVEMAGGDVIWEFDPATSRWTVQSDAGAGTGYTAVADFGTYLSDPAQDDRASLDGIAEIGVVANGWARVENLHGRTVFGPVALPASSGGGPPTIGDFDGDGRVELAASGSDSMTIFDPDCSGTPDPLTCPTLRTDGILWSQPSQDHSSNVTGSSLFDFEGDGPVEVVYADECFVRVYRGVDGKVLFSQWRSSCTWNENPIVADVDGDYSSELVVPSNESCGTAPSSMGTTAYETSPNGHPMDPLFVGLPCQDGTDCSSGLCDANYCRCSNDNDCGGDGFVCASPPGGTPGSGNTCRAEWLGSIHGVRVYRDALDRWVGSRAIWNQHAYSITNVEEDGTIPRTSQAELNWQVAGLNNFRQNIQGDLNPDHSPDLTGGQGTFGPDCTDGNLPLFVRVCNRGTNPIAAGAGVDFFDGDPDTGGSLVCAAATTLDLEAGVCETVTCIWQNAPVYDPHDLIVIVDYDSQRSECLETNNRASIIGATCPYQ
ncbi:MAG: VCBS repeat-containing protein [Deltaproteobacteria bacterium]|nr:VCBS repeat-containing protein [Deltaproteobacteria bacterium]